MRHLLVMLAVTIAMLSTTSSGAPRPPSSPTWLHHGTGLLNPHAGHALGIVQAPGLSVAVDGAVNPEAIPDDRALAHFLAAIASANPRGLEIALKQVGLDAVDRAAFVSALGPLGTDLVNIYEQQRAGGAVERFQQQRGIALDNARARLQGALTAAGKARIDTYIRTKVKRRIKIYRGDLPPAPAQERVQ